ncbi:phosphinothricin acetyltransferase [Diplodia corticola]|uniref:Phosphinothricin acetyltransferase n=1 Tax=Diplodia corticola TaxID=236234 RepID=A0A1J9QQ18_9PEZI|nr:phosphinothricin acetyltransferase [Diplodia corticola]OJD30122.1 phosphinothricin acetyltransferase [Diplodia corticola]
MTDIKPQSVPPHLRQRVTQTQYVPPHLRKATHNGSVNHDGGVSLNTNATSNKEVGFNDNMARDGGVTPSQSYTQATTAPLSAVTTEPAQAPEQAPQVSQTPQANQVPETSHATETNQATQASQAPQANPDMTWSQNPPPAAPHAIMNHRYLHKQDSNETKPKRNTKWITNKEIRERALKDSNGRVGAWGSNGSDTGFESNPAADPQHDIKKLVDWEGNWLPGPTDWESRRSYRHHNFNEEMMRFVYGTDETEAAVDITKEPSFSDVPNGEVAPRVWASIRIEGSSLQEWWNNHVGSSLADPESKAWWRNYSSEDSSLLVPYDVPEAKIDPADDEGQILHVHDLGSGNACAKLMERKNKKKADRERRNAREREHLAATIAEVPHITFGMTEKIKPTISLYIRPALAADAHQIAGIYNHYIHHSIRSAEVMPLSVPELARRIADETSNFMPWLVACQKGKRAGRGYTNGTDASVLGFACASDYLSRQSMYAFTAEAEVFIHPNYIRYKIGSCLMDRLLYILDPFYYAMEGYQFTGTGPFADHGGARVIGSVIMNVPFDRRDPEDLKGIVKFLNKFNFKKEAELPDIGVKKEMNVSLATFRYYTGNTIDPKSALFS